LFSAHAEQFAKKPASAGFFMDKFAIFLYKRPIITTFSAFPESPHHNVFKIW
jgi:hypothetical protein